MDGEREGFFKTGPVNSFELRQRIGTRMERLEGRKGGGIKNKFRSPGELK